LITSLLSPVGGHLGGRSFKSQGGQLRHVIAPREECRGRIRSGTPS
jgi:hypothetical protein